MASIIYIEADGTRHMVSAACGESLCKAALDHLVPGIVGDCGGNCSCGTCHGYIEGGWYARLPGPEAAELAMLESALAPSESSRLLCQVIVSDALDGLEVGLRAPQF